MDTIKSNLIKTTEKQVANLQAMPIKAYGTDAAKEDLKLMKIKRRALLSNDVEIDILYCGVCHSDLHTARNDWHGSVYPVVPGHEIVGIVVGKGDKVSKFNIGDYVAVGCMVDSCRTCDNCAQDLEQYCLNGGTNTYNSPDKHLGGRTMGGYAERVVVTEAFVVKMPKNLDLAAAAPLLCAGITTWSPLKYHNVTKGSKVAVIGLGGLGHMAIKLAKALGAEVALFSRSASKMQDAKRLGADQVIISTNAEEMLAAKGKFDVIIDTVPYDHDLNPYIQTLATNGNLVLVGFIGKSQYPLNTGPMISRRRSVGASVIGGIKETQEMLDFCGEHNITSDVEIINMQDINAAYERMLASDVHYRFVIDMASLKAAEN